MGAEASGPRFHHQEWSQFMPLEIQECLVSSLRKLPVWWGKQTKNKDASELKVENPLTPSGLREDRRALASEVAFPSSGFMTGPSLRSPLQ